MPGKIPQSFIDDLLARADIVDVIQPRLPLKKSGRNYVARCPFHDEKTPSFTVSPQKQFYYCFGCGASGSAIGFLMAHDHLSFPEAVETLASQYGMVVPCESQASTDPQAPQRRGLYESLYRLNQEVAVFYARQLRQPVAEKAVAYLRQRGVDGGIANRYGLGFAPPGWETLTQRFDPALLQEAGLVSSNEKGGTYDRFRNRIMFPIRNRRGQVVGFGGRILDSDGPKYLNSPETPVFHKGKEVYGLYEMLQASPRPPRIIVVEGYMDVIALAQHGITNTVATLGTAATPEHIRLLFRYSDELVFCFDGDRAGRKASWRALESALPQFEEGRRIRFLLLPEKHDPDSLVREEGTEKFGVRLASATPLSEYFFQSLTQDLDLSQMESRAALSKRAGKYLRQLPAGVFRQMMYARLKELTGIQSVKSSDSQSGNRPRSQLVQPRLYDRMAALLIHHPHLYSSLPETFVDQVHAGIHGEVLAQLLNILGEGNDWTPAMIIERYRDSPHRGYMQALLSQGEYRSLANPLAEMRDAIHLLQKRNLQKRLEVLTKKADAGNLNNIEKQELKKLMAIQSAKPEL